MILNKKDLWYRIELEAYCVRGSLESTILTDSTKALVLAGTARKLRELADEVDANAEKFKSMASEK